MKNIIIIIIIILILIKEIITIENKKWKKKHIELNKKNEMLTILSFKYHIELDKLATQSNL